jgi:thiosulfate/3-mercaptopyruvate sulfurtransferase
VAFTTLIDARSLQALRGDSGVVIIDCRFDLQNADAGHDAYLKGHIPGAQYVDLNKDLSAPVTSMSGRHPLPAPQVFAATLSNLGVGDDTQVVAYDEANGSFAARAWWMLRWLGHRAAAVLDGGLHAWIGAGGALASGEERYDGDTLLPRALPNADRAAVIGAAEVAALLRDPRYLLVDARAAERYAGAVEPIDSIAGHIAGAVNHPFMQNLRPDGRFRPSAELQRLWDERLAGRAPENVVAMCGSGVTACHNLLSLEIAGLSGAKLYAGSWSEWIRDPSRAIARGA